MAVVDPLLSAERQNKISDIAIQHYENTVRLLLTNLFQAGRMAGQDMYPTKLEELLALMQSMPQYQAMLGGVEDARAQQALLRIVMLRQEVFGV